LRLPLRVGDITGGVRWPKTSARTSSTRRMKNRIFAIPTAVPAIPPKPRTAAISAMMRNVMAQ
jgi:hypothetical protein